MMWPLAALIAVAVVGFFVWSLSNTPPGTGMLAFGILIGLGAIAAGFSMASGSHGAHELGIVIALGFFSLGLLVAGAIRETAFLRSREDAPREHKVADARPRESAE